FEDAQGAVAYIRAHASAGDLVVVHPSEREGFRLYSRMDGVPAAPVVFGNTGWPCCARGKDTMPGKLKEADAIRDLDSMVPAGFRGRVWILYTTRPPHWDYVGFNEGHLWRQHMWDRGCPPGEYVALHNVAVSPMDCSP